MPPKEGREYMQSHIAKVGSWDIVKNDLAHLDLWLREKHISEIGVSVPSFQDGTVTERIGLGIRLLLWREKACSSCC
jgi:hypothetical protein